MNTKRIIGIIGLSISGILELLDAIQLYDYMANKDKYLRDAEWVAEQLDNAIRRDFIFAFILAILIGIFIALIRYDK
jgi:hypothetical protein